MALPKLTMSGEATTYGNERLLSVPILGSIFMPSRGDTSEDRMFPNKTPERESFRDSSLLAVAGQLLFLPATV